MIHTPRFQRSKVVNGLDVAASERSLILRTEQKRVGWILNLVAKFCCAGDLVENCAGTMAVVKEFPLLPEDQRFWDAKKMSVVSKMSYQACMRFMSENYLPLKVILSQMKSFAKLNGYS